MESPHLRALMAAYFHQDYDLNGDDDAAILVTFAESAWPADVDATIAEIDRLLAQGIEGLLDRFDAVADPAGYIVAENDEDVQQWLKDARTTLAACRHNAG